MANRRERRARSAGARAAEARPARPASRISDLFASAAALAGSGRTSEAIRIFGQILDLDPGHAESLREIGALAYRAGEIATAERFFRRACAADPGSAALQLNLGLSQRALGKSSEALEAFSRAVALEPAFAEAQVCLADVLTAMNRRPEGVSALQRALAARPDYAEAHMNLGNLLREDGRLADAELHGRRAVALKPELAVAHRNLGVTLQDQGRPDEAIGSFEAAARLAPGWTDVQSNRLFCLNYLADRTAAEISAEHRRQAPLWDRPGDAAFSGRDRAPDRRLRIGYVSADLHQHPVGLFMTPVLEAHDATAVESFVYDNGLVADATTTRLRRRADHWRDIKALTDDDAASLVRSDQIDILVDLSGHTARNRLALFGRRAAPVQVSHLGYVSTTGLSGIDYVLTDPDTVPAGMEPLFSEAVVRLPYSKFCYAPPDYAPVPAPPPSARTGAITFGSFNHLLKLGPEVIELWSHVLHAAPGSRLVLKWPALAEPSVRDRYARAFEACGVEDGRLEFRGFSPHPAMLGEYADIDIALDPFPHCGGLTTCEALWMGVPVVTLPQERPASRQSLSLLNLVGLGELAAGSKAAYVEIASSLAADPARLTALRSGLRRRMAASPLCDGAGSTRRLEAAYREMWRRWSAGLGPAPFDVAPAQAPGG